MEEMVKTHIRENTGVNLREQQRICTGGGKRIISPEMVY